VRAEQDRLLLDGLTEPFKDAGSSSRSTSTCKPANALTRGTPRVGHVDMQWVRSSSSRVHPFRDHTTDRGGGGLVGVWRQVLHM
jgi:hypothetical protein